MDMGFVVYILFLRVNNFLIECSCSKIFVVKYTQYVEKK